MSTAELAVLERGGPVASAAEIRAQVNLIQEVMRAVMKDGVHYGTIPGTPKPTLYKPGAEKILSTFRIAIEPIVEDLSTADEARFRVQARATSQATGQFLGSGVGECSSNEEKYRWRAAVCDQEFEEAADDRRRSVWKRGRDKPYQVRQGRTSHADVANTILKMAKKRAQIDVCLTVTAASDVFAQDIEDLPEELREAVADEHPPTMQPPQRKSQSSVPTPPPAPPAGAVFVTKVDARDGETNGRKWKLHIVDFSDGRQGSTLDVDLATLAVQCRDSRPPTAVECTLEPGKKQGQFKLSELAKYVPPAEHAETLTPGNFE